ncbi:serine hydrolase [Desulfosporosinus sp. PR]|uniref:serine hydrolase n=1 Tax=Candidatus Desulfosporosinus nitrosoreducens TaxID=3401928 RepID=UPI0027FDDE53|nr:serine hydrolase [Desulfosporosinus sp. PR]MDQ7093534.1 serine hydrolase [Desulfosporosinus sp. PR]
MDNDSLKETKSVSPEKVLETIQEYIKSSLDEFHIPGTAVAVVKDDDIIFLEGFGKRDIEHELPVTPDTLFAIGSSTKAFTTMSVGILVDDGKLDWDKPVATYVPEFKLQDQYASENATLRDLATHRVGLPRHDLVWYKAPLSRAEIVLRLSHLAFSKPFRTTFQYQNMMYLTLGYVVEKISKQSWETFVRTRILDPLGMKRTNFSVNELQHDNNFAKPYKVVKQTIKETSFANIDSIGPAGSINSSVREMAQWVRLHLNNGNFQSNQLISENNLKQMHSPHISTGPSQDGRILFPSYGLGWFTEVYRGHHLVQHGGNIDGFTALVAMVPRENMGIVILSNQEHSVFPTAAAYTILDTFLELPKIDWNTFLKDKIGKLITSQSKNKGQVDENRVLDTKPSHEQSAYVGEFEHPAYGVISITAQGDHLYIGYHALAKRLVLEHYHYDVFSFAFNEVTFSEGDFSQNFKVQFHSDLRGKISHLTVQFELLLEPIEFVRKTAAKFLSQELLEKYVGEYDLAGVTVSVALRNQATLTATVPGQPTYELLPSNETEFSIKGLSGFEIQFVLDERGACSEAKFKQPNGTFGLKRK